MNRLVRILCFFLVNMTSLAVAQAPGVGLYAFGSFDSRGFDTINLGNLNTHFAIPIVAKPGRGLNFTYSIVYDGLVWSPITVSGVQQWAPDSSFGFHNQFGSGITGYLTYSQTLPGEVDPACPFVNGRPADGIRFSNYVYHDRSGRSHAINYVLDVCGTGPIKTGNGSSSDGFSFDGTEVHDSAGKVINAPSNPTTVASTNGSMADTNGNSIVNNGNGTFTDTLGVTALTIGGTGSASSPLTLSYPVTLQPDSSTSATATVYYKTYTIETKFQCSGISEYGATTDLVDHITLADGASTYSFTYEATPGVSGPVTGRLASITLPTGGTITYSYSGGCNSSGINSDGTVGSLTRTTGDGTRTYGRSPLSGPGNANSTTVTDEKNNQSVYKFSSVNGMFYETNHAVYQGAVGGPQLLGTFTCYNGVQPDCTGGVVTPPFTQSTVVRSYNGGAQDSVVNTYDASGMLTASTRGWWGQTPMQAQSFSYNSLEEVTQATTSDGTGNLVAQTIYGYDETSPTATSGIPQHTAVTGTRGNQTSAHVSTGSGTLTTTTTYYDTGVPIAVTTPNGMTNYGYDPTQTLTHTQTTLPTPSSGVQLVTSASYDQQSGAPISTTGMNSQTTQVTQYDPLLRPLSISLPNGGQISNTIFSVIDTGNSQTMGNGQSTNVRTLVDAYGRQSRVAVLNGQSSNPWYQIDYCYDATGLLQFQSVPYQGNGWGTPKQCSGSGTSYVYDALGRVTSTTNADGTAYRQYNGRAIETTDVNGVQRIMQYDLLGRILSVCEISSSTLAGVASSPCSNVDISGTGFQTNYSYNLASHTTTITQGAQTRVFQTDAAGRTIYTSEPERGVTTYGYLYNGTGLQVTRTRPQANQNNSNVLTTTITQYDSLGRTVSLSYNDGVTPNKNFFYDMATGWNGMNLGASKGRLTYAWTNQPWTGTQFVYDSMGKVVQSVQCLPNRCGNPIFDVNLLYSHDLVGNLTKDTYFLGANSGAEVDTNYSLSPAGELTSISNTLTGTTNYSGAILSNIQNGPFGPTSYVFGNGRTGTSIYDPLGRLNGKTVYAPPEPTCVDGCYTYYMTSTIHGSQVTQLQDSSLERNLTMTYDEFGRLTSTINGGSVTSAYSYDRWGNRLTENSAEFEGDSSSLTFNPANNQVVGGTYDAAGNLTSDGADTYSYDAEGNQIASSAASMTSIYDAFNHRVQFIQYGGNTQFAFNPEGKRVSMWQGTSSTPTLIEAATYWNGQMVSYYDGTGTTFTHYDAFGTKRAETNYNYLYNSYVDGWTSTYTSLPFGDGYGDGYGNGGLDGDPNHFAELDGGEQSPISVHAQFREYYLGWGRWMSPDPYDGSYDPTNPQSLNRYAYVLNNPLAATDPSGQMMEQDGGCDFYDCSGGATVGDGGGVTTYYLDGLGASASTVQRLLSMGVAAVCPADTCGGFISNGQYMQYSAFATGGNYYANSGPGALYWNLQAAGTAAALYMEQAAIDQNREYGGAIYQDANGVYSYTQPQAGPPCDVLSDACEINIDTTVPDGTSLVGSYHDHPDIPGGQSFSQGGPNSDIFGLANANMFGFLGTAPYGRVLMFDPNQFNLWLNNGTGNPTCVIQGPLLGGVPCH
jgi:RHS repeat-associated protein